MGMTYTFKDANGNMIFSVEGVNSVTDNNVSLESMANNICKKNNEIRNSLDKIDFLSNTKAMEAFGFISTESAGEKIKEVVSKIGENIQKLFERIAKFFRGVFEKINKRLNSAAAKRAAAEVIKKMENPTDMDKNVELAKVTAVINSDNMGVYVVLKKNYNTLTKIKNFISTTKGNPSDKELFKNTAAAFKTKLVELEEAAKRVSSGEKRKEAVAFYKEMSTTGTTKMSEAVGHELKDLEAIKDKVTQAWKSLDQRHMDAGDDHDTNVIVANYHLITALYGVLTKYVSAINSLAAAAIGAKNEVITGQDKD